MTKIERAAALDEYRAAFAEANPDPNSEVPEISYEGGWWCFRDKYIGYSGVFTNARPQRYRSRDFLSMTDRLRQRLIDR